MRIRDRLRGVLSQPQPTREIPDMVKIGRNFTLHHAGIGVVLNGHVTIGDNVQIFPNVLVGRYDGGTVPRYEDSLFEHVVIEDDVILYANSVIVARPGVTTISAGTILGAGAVLLNSTGPGEVWAGNPARRVGDSAARPL